MKYLKISHKDVSPSINFKMNKDQDAFSFTVDLIMMFF